VEVACSDRRGDRQAPLTQIGAQASPRYFDLRSIDFTSTQFEGERGFHFYDRQGGDDAARAWLRDHPLHIFGAALFVVQLRQCTRIEKVVWQLALLSLGSHGVGKRPGNSR